MKNLKFLIVGTLFGIVMFKSEAASWYRIQEMFRFQAFHMYGIIGLAVVIGIPVVAIIKAKQLKDYSGQEIVFKSKSWSIPRYLIGGAIFGLGWALSGACPGPIVVNMGVGYLGYAVVLVSAVLGTLLYGVIRDKLPH
ncbi:YeeE/YedE thiosulfate transporter family protein [Schleiferiaceae bacterium]|nr:YeeE/YedE thiosulfate transporter family protein [Schleiferiaceae bacterium]